MTSAATRPLRADARRNRERIVAAARDVFARSGEATQMDDVAAQAGVGVGTVYRHFPTKQALMGEMIAERFIVFLANARAALEHDGEPFAVFADLLRRNAELVAEDVGTQHAMQSADDAIWSAAIPVRDELLDVTAILIERAQLAGTMRADLTAWDVPLVMCGIGATMAVPGKAYDWRRHLDLVLDGMRSRA